MSESAHVEALHMLHRKADTHGDRNRKHECEDESLRVSHSLRHFSSLLLFLHLGPIGGCNMLGSMHQHLQGVRLPVGGIDGRRFTRMCAITAAKGGTCHVAVEREGKHTEHCATREPVWTAGPYYYGILQHVLCRETRQDSNLGLEH